ncbi:MAG: BON domain-containing protein [Armatimonadota bacterium]
MTILGECDSERRELVECFRLRFDAAIEGSDGPVGSLDQILVDPGTGRVRGLIARTGFLSWRKVQLPWRAVVDASEETLELSLSTRDVWELRERQPKRGGPELAAAASPVALRSALPVAALDGPAGHLRQLRVDAVTGELVELVIESGLFCRQSRRIPAAWIGRITSSGIELDALLSAVAGQPHYRSDRELRAEILEAWFYDDLLRPILLRTSLDAKVREGVATLEGYVWSSDRRWRLIDRARSVSGVVEVRCEVVTDEELIHQVATALSADSRTWSLYPQIHSSLGVVSLDGRAPDEATREAASEVAATVPRAKAIHNRLRVGGGDGSPETLRAHSPRLGQRVFSQDGPYGRVSQVVLHASTRLLSGLVVREERPAPTTVADARPERAAALRRVVVPADWISTLAGEILLRVGRRELAQLPELRPGDYRTPPPGWVPPFPYECSHVLLSGKERGRTSDRERSAEGEPARGRGEEWPLAA